MAKKDDLRKPRKVTLRDLDARKDVKGGAQMILCADIPCELGGPGGASPSPRT